MSKEELLTQEGLRERLHYSPDSGLFVWQACGHPQLLGKIAGHKCWNGRIFISIFRHNYYAHRLAWLYVYGFWPTGMIDHINGIPDDNRIANLRLADHQLNVQNQRHAQKNNKTGFLGVTYSPRHKKFAATIGFSEDGKYKKKTIGYYETAEQAHEAYLKRKRELHPGCTI